MSSWIRQKYKFLLDHLIDNKGVSEDDMAIRRSKAQADTPRFGRLDADMADVESAICRSAEFLLSQQDPEGYWCGELEADAMLEADYIYLHMVLESGDPGRMKRALAEILRYQNEDGSWSIYSGRPGQYLAFGQMLSLSKADGH